MAEPRFTLLGKLVSIVLIAGLITLGGYMVMQRRGSAPSPSTGSWLCASRGGWLPAGAQSVPCVNTALATDDPMYAGRERLASRSSR